MQNGHKKLPRGIFTICAIVIAAIVVLCYLGVLRLPWSNAAEESRRTDYAPVTVRPDVADPIGGTDAAIAPAAPTEEAEKTQNS